MYTNQSNNQSIDRSTDKIEASKSNRAPPIPHHTHTPTADQPAERVSVRLHGHARVDRRWLPGLSLNAHTTRPLPAGPSSSTSSRHSHHHGASFAGEDNDAASQEQLEQEGGSLLSRLVGLSILGGGGGGGHGHGDGGNEGLLPAYPDLLQENLACVFTTPPYVLTRCVF